MTDYTEIRAVALEIGLDALAALCDLATRNPIDLAAVLTIESYITERDDAFRRGLVRMWNVTGPRTTRRGCTFRSFSRAMRERDRIGADHVITVGYGDRWTFQPVKLVTHMTKALMELT